MSRLGFSETPSPAATRSLVMIAKCLQNLANLVEFGAKESYMEVVNPFILKNKERMVVFLDHLSVSTTQKNAWERKMDRNVFVTECPRKTLSRRRAREGRSCQGLGHHPPHLRDAFNRVAQHCENTGIFFPAAFSPSSKC